MESFLLFAPSTGDGAAVLRPVFESHPVWKPDAHLVDPGDLGHPGRVVGGKSFLAPQKKERVAATWPPPRKSQASDVQAVSGDKYRLAGPE